MNILRTGNPTRHALEMLISDLEGGSRGVCIWFRNGGD